MKPYYEQAGVTLYHGDCRDVLPALALPTDSLVLLDPPYGISHTSTHGASWAGTRIENDDSTALRDWLIAALAPRPMIVFGIWRARRPDCRAMLIWDKGPQTGAGDLTFPWKPSWEEVYVIGNGFAGYRDEGVLRGFRHITWECKGRRHPHEKPVSLMAHFVNKHPAAVIIDPCCGTAPTLRAAKDLGRRAIGIELEERYCEVAARRLSQGVLPFPPAGAKETELPWTW